MKYFKRAGIYKASNVTFNPATCEAYSYNWWAFVKKIKGKVVFNFYYYSPSTRKHQSKVEKLLRELGIKVDLYVEIREGLQGIWNLKELNKARKENFEERQKELEAKRIERNYTAKVRRHAKKLEDYLENQVHFRDYEIKQGRQFGKLNIIAVHQCVDLETLETDVENALYNFHRDGFGKVVFYVGGIQ